MIITDKDFDLVWHTLNSNFEATGTTCTFMVGVRDRACTACKFKMPSHSCSLHKQNKDYALSLARYSKSHPEWFI